MRRFSPPTQAVQQRRRLDLDLVLVTLISIHTDSLLRRNGAGPLLMAVNS